MPHIYSAQSHDWDLTLRAAHDLLRFGQVIDRLPREGTLSSGFSCLTGSMLLSFCAIESFSASVAFSLPNDDRFRHFDFEEYKQTFRFWDKIEMLCGAIGVELDKSQGMFQKIGEMQRWRNLVTHASPYEIVPIEIAETVTSPKKLHKQYQHKQFPRLTTVKNAEEFYTTAYDYIVLIRERSQIDPRPVAEYQVGGAIPPKDTEQS